MTKNCSSCEWFANNLKPDQILYYYSESNIETEALISFWKTNISKCYLEYHSLTLSQNTIIEFFIFDGVFPSSLKKLLTTKPHFLSSAIKPKTQFLQFLDKYKESNNIFNLVQEFTSLSFSFFESNISHDFYVSVEVLEFIEKGLSKKLPSIEKKELVMLKRNVGRFLSFIFNQDEYNNFHDSALFKIISSLDEENIEIVVGYMIMKNKAFLSEDRKILKFESTDKNQLKKDNSIFSFLNSSPRITITESEVARIQLKESISVVEEKAELYDKKAKLHLNKAREFKKNNQDKRALIELDIKRNVIKMREKLLDSLISLYKALESIDQSEVTLLLTDAYKVAAQSLKTTKEATGLSIDSVEKAMDAFEDEMDALNEVNEVFEQRMNEAVIFTDDQKEELEKELELLMEEDTKQVQEDNITPDILESIPKIPENKVKKSQSQTEKKLDPKLLESA